MIRPQSCLRPLFLGLCGALVLALAPVQPAVAQDIRQEQVAFPAGATGTRLTGRITGRESVSYLLGAEAGQTIDLSLTSASTSVYFNLYAPGKGPGDEALVIGEQTEELNRYSGTLPASGTYTISVFLYRNAARDGATADFMLDVSITGATGAVVQGDFADGLAGGPDFLGVATRDGGALNLRAEASAGAAVVTRLAQGAVVRNLGCRMAEGRRWCRVATLADPGFEGWAAGEFLVEAADPAAAAAPAPADPEAAAEQACVKAVQRETNNSDVVVMGSDMSQAGTLVQVGIGPDRAPWQCIAYADGSTGGIEFLGQDGGGVSPEAEAAAIQGKADAEAACLAAVAAETTNTDVALLSSEYQDAGGLLVRVGIGPDRAPWRCTVFGDGSIEGVMFEGEG